VRGSPHCFLYSPRPEQLSRSARLSYPLGLDNSSRAPQFICLRLAPPVGSSKLPRFPLSLSISLSSLLSAFSVPNASHAPSRYAITLSFLTCLRFLSFHLFSLPHCPICLGHLSPLESRFSLLKSLASLRLVSSLSPPPSLPSLLFFLSAFTPLSKNSSSVHMSPLLMSPDLHAAFFYPGLNLTRWIWPRREENIAGHFFCVRLGATDYASQEANKLWLPQEAPRRWKDHRAFHDFTSRVLRAGVWLHHKSAKRCSVCFFELTDFSRQGYRSPHSIKARKRNLPRSPNRRSYGSCSSSLRHY